MITIYLSCSLIAFPQEVVRRFTDRTEAYWQKWSRSLSIMPEYQDATIRAAITLKLTS